MKKLIAIILAVLMCLSILASCTPTEPEDTTAPAGGDTTTEQAGNETTEPEGAEYDVEAAAEYVDSLYKKGNTVTAADYTVVAQVMIAGVKYTITWAVDNELVKAVQGESAWTIDVDEKAAEEHTYKLTGTITAPDGTTATVSYDRTVPKYVLVSFEDYMAAEKGTTVVIEGIVVAMNGKSANNKYNHLFLADASGKGGYYCYALDDDPVAAGVKVGMTVSVTSVVEPYSGMQELKGGTFTIVDDTIKTVEPLDITEKFAAGADLKNYVAMAVTIKGVKIGTQDMSKDTSQYLYFSIGEKEGYVRTYVSDFPTTLEVNLADGVYTSPDKAIIDADHAAHFGYKADVTGVLILYSGNPYLIPMSVTPFTNYEEINYTPAQKIDEEIKNLEVIANITENTTVELPLAGQFFEDVAIAWTVDNEAYTIDADGKMVVALADEQVKLTLTATFTCGEETKTETYTIIVKALAKGVYTSEHVENPVVDTAYKFYLYNATLEKFLYFNGTISDKYLGTSENVADGVDVYLEAVLDGETVIGYRFYFDNAGTKTYIDIVSGGKAALVTENPTAVYSYVAETNIWAATVEGTEYYLGTYVNNGKTYTTISASKSSYINADNTGVTQYPAGFAVAVAATYVPNNEKAPVADKAYKFYLYNATLEKFLYFNGTISDKYLGTSENAADGVDVFVEAVLATDGTTVTGYRFFFMDGETKTYIDIVSGGKAALVTENPTAVYNYVAETNIWAATVEGIEYYLGTYVNNGKTYTTISASKSSYINADNTGVTQYPAGFATLTVKKVEPSSQKEPVADKAYKFFLYNATLEKFLYFNGTINDKYLGTSTDPYESVDVYVEAVLDGETVIGYRFYFDNAGTKTYIDIISGGKAALVTENPTAVYNYVAETNIWAATVEGTEYYLGTYVNNGKTYTTISASKSSYINADNTGVTQYPAGFAVMAPVVEDEHVCEFGDATCTDPATCECGKTQGDALGHKITDKVCENCGAKVVTVTEAAALEDGTLVLITATVSKITYAWSDSNKNMSVDITDGTTTLNAYKLASQVGAGDEITVYGKVGSYNNKKQIVDATATVVTAHTCAEFTDATCEAAKTCTVCGATQGDKLGHNYVDGVCDREGCGAEKPASTTYAFADYTAGEQYAANEVHKLDDDVTVTTTDCHFTTELRLYYSAINDYNPNGRNGVAVFAMSSAVKSLSLNAGNKTNPLAIYGSTDGVEWTLITTITPASAYTDYDIELGETAYTFIKLAATEGQVRVASITVELA